MFFTICHANLTNFILLSNPVSYIIKYNNLGCNVTVYITEYKYSIPEERHGYPNGSDDL